MNFFRLLPVLILLLCTVVRAIDLTLEGVPACPLQCLSSAITASPCNLTDFTCSCSNEEIFQKTTSCVLRNCSVSHGLLLSKARADICGQPRESRQHSIRLWLIGLAICVLSTSTLRYISCLKIRGGLFQEDYLIILAILLYCVLQILMFQIIDLGFGMHVYQLEPQVVGRVLKIFFIAENLYAVEVIVIKVSLCCFFLRIFPQKQFRICCYALVILMSTLAVAWVLLLVFQCKPITSNWNITIEHPRCYNIQIYAYAGAVAAMSQDMCILALPIPLVLKLRISTKKKIGVIAMFSLGISVTIISAVRTQFIYYFGTSSDPSWDNVDITIWTSMEISAGLVCCNMPACARLIAHLHREYIYPRRLSIEETHKPLVSKISSQSLADCKGSMQSSYQSSSSRQSPEHPVPMQSQTKDLNFELDIECGIPKTEVDLRLGAKMVTTNEPNIPVTKLCERGVKLTQGNHRGLPQPQSYEKTEDIGPRFDRMMQMVRKDHAEIEVPSPVILRSGITVRKEFTIEEILIENIKNKMKRGNLAAPKLHGERDHILNQQGNLRHNQHSGFAETPEKQAPVRNFWEKPSQWSFDNP